VTGAARGIGRATAELFLARGWRVGLYDVDRDAVTGAAGGRDRAVPGVLDVRDAAQWQTVLTEFCGDGGLDVLVNNAGVGALGPFDEAGPERLRQVMELNFFALAEMTRLALPLLKRGQRPMIVNIGSILSHRAVPRSSEYCASKFAVRGLSQSLRAELRPLGIDVLLVSPASTQSEFWEHLIEQRGQPSFRGRPAPAELVARRIARAIERGDTELFPTWSARLVAWTERASPRLLEWLISRRT